MASCKATMANLAAAQAAAEQMGYNGPPPKGAKPVGHVPPPTPVLPPESYTTERYECTTNGHNKFWEVWYPAAWSSARSWGVRFGAIGTQGQTKSWTENSTGVARVTAETAAMGKLHKGYIKVSGKLVVGQDTATPSEAWTKQHLGPDGKYIADKPPIKIQLSPVPLHPGSVTSGAALKKKLADANKATGIGSLTPAQIQAAASLLKAGMTHAVIAKTLHINAQQVAAVAQSPGDSPAPAEDLTGKRKFDWSE